MIFLDALKERPEFCKRFRSILDIATEPQREGVQTLQGWTQGAELQFVRGNKTGVVNFHQRE